MKKTFIFCALILIFGIQCLAQTTGQFLTPYSDALTLEKYLNKESIIKISNENQLDTVFNILIKYIKNKDGVSVTNLKNSFDHKPGVADTTDPNPYINIDISSLHSELKQKFSASGFNFANIGGFDVTSIADAFAKFIVKRTKQELNIAFFEKFQDELNKYPDLKSVFPQTYRALTVIGDEIYMYEAYIQTLRTSFEKDLASLPSNLPSIIYNHTEYFNAMPELKAELLTAFYVAQALQNKQHPGEIIENYPINYLASVNLNVKAAFQTLQLFSTSLKSNNDSTYWVSAPDVMKHFNDTLFLKLYLGLVLQIAKNDPIVFTNYNGKQINLADEMIKYYREFKEYQPYMIDLATKAQTLDTKIKRSSKIKNDSVLFENYYSVVSTSVDLMKHATQIDRFSFFRNDSLKLEEKTKQYFDLAQAAADIFIDVNRRNYSSAIVNGVYLFKEVFDSTNVKKFIEKKYSKISKKDIDIKYNEFIPIPNKLFKYGSFMVAIAQAGSSDEMESAIEAIALPTGSARIKRETQRNVSVNAYCGFFGGQDRTNWKSQPISSYGITAPIGIAISWGRKHHSISAFVSIIDLGAVTSFRFKNDTAAVSKITLKDIISPGVFFSYGIPKSPISINAGCQLTPLLTAVSSSGNSFEAKMFRFSLSFCVDIPILNLYTKPK
jgi:hypothetical protein